MTLLSYCNTVCEVLIVDGDTLQRHGAAPHGVAPHGAAPHGLHRMGCTAWVALHGAALHGAAGQIAKKKISNAICPVAGQIATAYLLFEFK